MPLLRFVLIFIEVASSVLLLLAILIQKSRGYGIGSAFGGAGETVFGAQLGTVLTKATVILAVIFLLNTTVLAFVGSRFDATSRSVTDSAPVNTSQPAGPLAPQTTDSGNVPFDNSGAGVPMSK